MIARAATAEDIPAVLPLVAKTVAFHEHLDPARFGAIPDAADRYEGWIRGIIGSGQGVVLVAEVDGRIVGFILGAMQDEVRIYRVRRLGFLHDLWVEEDVRRQGIAKALVLDAMRRFKALGAEQVRLDSAYGNKAAQALFAACGLRPAVIEMLAEV